MRRFSLLGAMLLGALMLGSGSVAQGTLLGFLEALDDHPALRASRAGHAAAAVQLDGVRTPVGFSASGGHARFTQDVPDWYDELPEELRDLLGLTGAGSANQLELSVTFRPIMWGDIADAEAQLQLETARQQTNYRETRAQLEAQAIEAAARVRSLVAAKRLAQQGLALASEGEAATDLRRERGAASAAEARDAASRTRDAEAQLRQAERDLALAEAALADLVGTAPAPDDIDIPQVRGVPLEVERAQLDVETAEIGVAGAHRDLYPVAQASYTYNAEGERSSVSASIESRTLQPTVTYRYQDGAGAAIPGQQARSSFQIGVAMELSGSTFAALESARLQLGAARAGLELAERTARMYLDRLDAQLEQAQSQLALARQNVEDSVAQLAEIDKRVELGLATDLERNGAQLERDGALLDQAFAELEVLSARLAYYPYYGVPVSAALKLAEAGQ